MTLTRYLRQRKNNREAEMELVIEIHAGAGGDDSKNFVHELAEIYKKHAAKYGLS